MAVSDFFFFFFYHGKCELIPLPLDLGHDRDNMFYY